LRSMGAALTYLDEPDTDKELQDGGSLEKHRMAFGYCAMQGWRRNMEDAHLAIPDFDDGLGLFGVFDGHGGRGVSRFAAQRLPDLLKENEAFKSGDYKKALEEVFVQVDVELRAPAGRAAVATLDQPDPGKKAAPLIMPRSVVRRLAAQSGVTLEVEDEDEANLPNSPIALDELVAEADGEGEEEEDGSEDFELDSDAMKMMSDDPEQAEAEAEGEPAKSRGKKDAGKDVITVGNVTPADGEGDSSSQALVSIDPSALTRDSTPEAQGCTAVVVLVVRRTDGEGPRLVCANAGDSRAVLGREGLAVALSEDHKPECPVETARINKAGGFVDVNAPGGPRVQGDLNLSRAMGDLRYKMSVELPPEEQIVTAFPEVRTIPLKDEDEFMVLGCDGIWERLSNQEAVDFVRPRLAKQPEALSAICAEVCDRGLCESMDTTVNPGFDGHGCDNMTIALVQLKSQIKAEEGVAGSNGVKRAADAEPETNPDTKRPKPSEGEGEGEASV